ncbi:MAG: FAD-dependent oxidoreductase [Firmicutes bacterium]|nr:FAD-dependent oxidoreductase [Bacillota bacterium]
MGKKSRLVVVGGGAAGMSAAAKARRTNPEMEILAFERSGFVSYGACGLPYYVKGDIPDYRALVIRTPEQFAKQGISVRTHHEVVDLDTAGCRVAVRDLHGGTESTVVYDVLVLAAGAVPARPPLPGLDLAGIFSLRQVEDGIAIRTWIEERAPRKAVIVGGGYIGLEMAEALAAHGIGVTVLEMLPQLLPNFDPPMAALAQKELARQGVEVHLGHRVEAFLGNGHVRAVAAGGREFPADMVVLGAGARPRVDLARRAGIALGPTGAVAVDRHMRTNLENVFAAGDVAEVHHLVTGRPAYIPLGTTANKQGRVAGENAAGGRASFAGVVGSAVLKVFDWEFARTGLSEREAREAGLNPRVTEITHESRARYYPGSTPVHVRLVADGEGRLLGAQMAGRQGVAHRINVLAAALHARWSVDDVAALDLAYAPPFAPVWDPILIAASAAQK